MLLEGVFLPLTTPFHPDGRLFLSRLEQNVDRYSRTSVAGLHLLGANAEASSLTDHEACQILGVAIAAATPEKVMLADISRESVFSTLALAEAAAAVHYDAVTLAPPALAAHPTMTLELLTFFQTVADRSPLPIILVSDAQREIPLEVLTILAAHPNILGAMGHQAVSRTPAVLAATAKVSREVEVTTTFAAVTARMLRQSGQSGLVSAASLTGGQLTPAQTPTLKTRKKKVGFQLLTTNTADMLPSFKLGVTGAVPRLGASAPQACYEVFQAWKDQDIPLAAEKQERLLSSAAFLESPAGTAWAKFGCDLNAYFGGRPRLPLLPLTAAQQQDLTRELAGLHN